MVACTATSPTSRRGSSPAWVWPSSPPDLAGVVTYWNRHAEELYGWTSAEATGRAIYELTEAPVGQPHAEEIMAAVAAGQVWTGVFPVRHEDRTTVTALDQQRGARTRCSASPDDDM